MIFKKSLLLYTLIIGLVSACGPSQTSQKAKNVATGTEIGQLAPELAYPNPDGDKLSLYALRGKMVLIDFWASWCSPCRTENPTIVSVYNDFMDVEFKNGEGFTVYSVSCDRKHDEWVAAIKADNLTWRNHVSDLKGWNAQATFDYNVSYIPYNFLIDGDGIIIAKELHGDDLRNTLDSLRIWR